MKPFDLEKALAGEPVKLRNGLKAYIKYVMPEQYKGDYPLRGFLLNLKGNVSETAWTMQGIHSIFEQNTGLDVIGMWQEPRPRVQLDLPCPLKEPQEGMYVIDSHFEIYKSDNQGQRYNTKAFDQGRYFATKEDAQEWLDAMRNARR